MGQGMAASKDASGTQLPSLSREPGGWPGEQGPRQTQTRVLRNEKRKN